MKKISPTKIKKIDSLCDKIDNGIEAVYGFRKMYVGIGSKNEHSDLAYMMVVTEIKLELNRHFDSLKSLCESIPNYEINFAEDENGMLKILRPY